MIVPSFVRIIKFMVVKWLSPLQAVYTAIKTGWRIYASLSWINIGLGYSLSPVLYQAIAWTMLIC